MDDVDMKVQNIMKKHVVTVDPKVDLGTVAKILTNNRVGSVIVMEKGKPVGMITDTDIVTAIANGRKPEKMKLRDMRKLRKKEFITVSPHEQINKVAKKFVKTGRKRFPVVENGELKGVVSSKEILIVAPQLLEVLSEKLRAKVDSVARPEQQISGICERCDEYSDELKNTDGRWLCPECRE